MMHVPLMFLSDWREFPSAPCLAGKKNVMTARVSMLLKSRASPDMHPCSLCNKTCNSAHEQTPLSNDTIDSVLRHREVGRANELSATPRIGLKCCHILRPAYTNYERSSHLLRGGSPKSRCRVLYLR